MITLPINDGFKISSRKGRGVIPQFSSKRPHAMKTVRNGYFFFVNEFPETFNLNIFKDSN